MEKNSSEILALLDHKGVSMQFYQVEDWCEKTAWDTLKFATIRDSQLALLFIMQDDVEHTRVKRHVAETENADRETPAMMAAFVGICMMRN